MVTSALKGASPRCKYLPYTFQNALHVLHHVVVPESEDAIARGFQNCGARRVSFGLLTVMPAVQLDHQIFGSAAKIDDVMADHELTCEFETIELSSTQVLPQLVLSRREVTP